VLIGLAHEDPAVLRAAIAYLARYALEAKLMEIDLVIKGTLAEESESVAYDERADHVAADAARAAIAALTKAGITVTHAALSSGHFAGGTLDLLATT